MILVEIFETRQVSPPDSGVPTCRIRTGGTGHRLLGGNGHGSGRHHRNDRFVTTEPEYVADVEGDIQCYLIRQFHQATKRGVTLLIRTFELGCQQIADSYEETYIQIKRHNLEVQDNVEG